MRKDRVISRESLPLFLEDLLFFFERSSRPLGGQGRMGVKGRRQDEDHTLPVQCKELPKH